MPDVLARLGMNNLASNNNNLEELTNIEAINKDEAILIIERIIRENPKDKTIIKDLMPKLSELKEWKKETITTKTNVIQYELPKKKI